MSENLKKTIVLLFFRYLYVHIYIYLYKSILFVNFIGKLRNNYNVCRSGNLILIFLGGLTFCS